MDQLVIPGLDLRVYWSAGEKQARWDAERRARADGELSEVRLMIVGRAAADRYRA